MNKTLISINGPTAVGKTSLAIELAKLYSTEILSCDSRQFYKQLNIGVAKPSDDELHQVRHHFISNIDIQTPYTVGDYEKGALELLNTLFKTNDYVVLVGGSGLYEKALVEGLDTFPKVETTIKDELSDDLQKHGITYLAEELKKFDPIYHAQVDLSNPRRIQRALEVIRTVGKPFSDFLNQEKTKRPFNTVRVGLEMDRSLLYDRINHRVDIMMKMGLLKEVEKLLPYKDLKSMQTVGYQEFYDYFEGNCSLEKSIELVKRNSRRYAKRQMTWYRKYEEMKWINPSKSSHLDEIRQYLTTALSD